MDQRYAEITIGPVQSETREVSLYYFQKNIETYVTITFETNIHTLQIINFLSEFGCVLVSSIPGISRKKELLTIHYISVPNEIDANMIFSELKKRFAH
jgi:hypothetical protein